MLRTVRYHSQTVWGWFTRAHRVVPHLLPTHLAIIPPTHPTHQGYPPRLPTKATKRVDMVRDDTLTFVVGLQYDIRCHCIDAVSLPFTSPHGHNTYQQQLNLTK